MSQTVGEFGRLDTLVNNAGVMLLGPIVGAPLEEWQRMVSPTSWGCSTVPTRRCRTSYRLLRMNPVPLRTW